MKQFSLPPYRFVFILILFLLAPPALSVSAAQPSELRVGRLIDSDNNQYLQWLKDEFEKKQKPGSKTSASPVQVMYDPPLGAPEENSSDRFKRLVEEGKVDLFLGGGAQLHQTYQNQLEPLPRLISQIKKEIPHYDKAKKTWIAYYVKLLGLAWDKRCAEKDWVPRRLADLNSLKTPASCISIPRPGTSGGRDFAVALGTGAAGFDPAAAGQLYADYLKKYPTSAAKQPSSEYLIALGRLAAAVVWPHDAATAKANRALDCLGIAIPDDAQFSVSAISVRRHPKNKLAQAFVRFALSRDSQAKHYQLEKRWPADAALFAQAMKEKLAQRELDYFDVALKRQVPAIDEAKLQEMMTDPKTGLLNLTQPVDFKVAPEQLKDLRGCAALSAPCSCSD